MNKTLKEIIEEIKERLLDRKIDVGLIYEAVTEDDIEKVLDDYYELNRWEN